MINFLTTILKEIPLKLIWEILITIFPVKEILTHFMELLKTEAAKSNTKLDDAAVFAIDAILEKAGLIDLPEVPK